MWAYICQFFPNGYRFFYFLWCDSDHPFVILRILTASLLTPAAFAVSTLIGFASNKFIIILDNYL